MKPIDPAEVPTHISRRQGGRTGLVHGPSPELSRSFTRARLNSAKPGRKGAKARARMMRVLAKRYGLA